MIGFVIGFREQRFELTVYIILAATALVMLLFGPGWPCLSKKPLKWLDAENHIVE